MLNFFGDCSAYIAAVGSHLFTLLAGCVLTVLIAIIEKHFNKKLSWKQDLLVMVFFLFFACFQAWQDEHAKVAGLESRLKEGRTHLYFKPQVLIAPPTGLANWPYKADDVPSFNIAISNTGGHIACDVNLEGTLAYLTPDESENQRILQDALEKNAKYYTSGCVPPIPTEIAWRTVSGEKLKDTDIDDFKNSKRGVCVVARAKWKDDSGCYEVVHGECQMAESGMPTGWNWHSLSMNEQEKEVKCEKPK